MSPTVRGGRSLDRTVQRFRDGLAFKARRLLYHSTLGLRVIKKKDALFAQVERQRHLPFGKREFKRPWREAGPPNHHDDKVDSDQ